MHPVAGRQRAHDGVVALMGTAMPSPSPDAGTDHGGADPTTRPSLTASAPPELPGCNAASVTGLTLSTNRLEDPDDVTRDLPRALTTPAVTDPAAAELGFRWPPPAVPPEGVGVAEHRRRSRHRPPARRPGPTGGRCRSPRTGPPRPSRTSPCRPSTAGHDVCRGEQQAVTRDDNGRARARGPASTIAAGGPVDPQPRHRRNETLGPGDDRARVRVECLGVYRHCPPTPSPSPSPSPALVAPRGRVVLGVEAVAETVRHARHLEGRAPSCAVPPLRGRRPK